VGALVAVSLQAIWEEVEAARLGGKAATQYVMMQLVTPENPTYLHNMAERSWDMDFDVPAMCGEFMMTYTACSTLIGKNSWRRFITVDSFTAEWYSPRSR